LPPWQSAQPSTTAGEECMVFLSLSVWQVTQPALFASAASQSWVRGADAARTSE
jgi:hypothetical protein